MRFKKWFALTCDTEYALYIHSQYQRALTLRDLAKEKAQKYKYMYDLSPVPVFKTNWEKWCTRAEKFAMVAIAIKKFLNYKES